MSITNINEETLPPHIDREQAFDDNMTLQRIIELGYEDKEFASRNDLTNILKYTILISPEEETSSESRLLFENRYQYALNSILGAISEDPISTPADSSSPLRRKNALEILSASYTSILSRDPQGASRIAYALTKKLDNPNQGTMKLLFIYDEEDKNLRKETSATLELSETIANNVGKQSLEISVNVFDAIIRNLKQTKDTHVYCEEIQLLEKFFNKAVETKEWGVYNTLVETFYNRIEGLDINNPDEYRVLNNISSIYSYILSFNIISDMPREQKLKINEKIFSKLISIVSKCKDDRIRASFIYPLNSAVLRPKEGEKWEQYPKLLKQQIDFKIRTLRMLTNLANQEGDLTGNYISDPTPYLHSTGDILLARMLAEYVDGVRFNDENWITVSKRFHPIYKSGLKALLKEVEKDNEDIKKQILGALKNFMSPTLLEDPKNPFLHEGTKFYATYYSKKLKQLNEEIILE